MAEARLVRFRAEWVAELPADPEPGDRVAVPFRELVVRGVAPSPKDARAALEDAQARGAPLRFRHVGYARDEDLGGADCLASLAPTLVEPGATWRASASLGVLGTLRKGDPSWYDGEAKLERDVATLGEALDAFPAWAEEWLAFDPPLKAPGGGPPELSGTAELAVVEPSGPEYGRTVLRVFLGTHHEPYDPERVISALEALCDEAERLYGDKETG